MGSRLASLQRPRRAQSLQKRATPRRREDPAALSAARAIVGELGATRWPARLDKPAGVAA